MPVSIQVSKQPCIYVVIDFTYVSTILQLDFETIFDNAVFLFLNFITQELCLWHIYKEVLKWGFALLI